MMMNICRRQGVFAKLAGWLLTLGIAWGWAVGPCTTLAARQPETGIARTPNLVLIVADDLGWGELGCYGQNLIQTPNIDKIAANGIRFTDFYSAQTVCAPSRCSLMTGRHQGHAYIRDNGNPRDRGEPRPRELYFPGQHPLPDDTQTLAERLKEQGYATAAIGKWGLGSMGSSGDPNRQGFDLFYGFNCQVHAHNHYPRFLWRNDVQERLPGNDRRLRGETYSQDRFTEVALQFIDEHRDRPFFLYLPLAIPHLSIQVPEKSLQAYRGAILEENYEHRGYLQHPEPRAGYAAMISHMDRDIGLIMDRLRDYELMEQTLVMFTSDNGPTYDRLGGSDSDYFQSAGPFRGRKGQLLEGGIRVPLVAQWPGQIAAGQTTSHLNAFWDILPTLCDAAGIDTSQDGLDGISFLPLMLGQQPMDHEFLYWEFPGYGGQQAVRMGQWKALRQGLHQNPFAKFQLFDLASDASESLDVAEDHPDVVATLTEIAGQQHTPSKLFPFPALDRQ